MDQQDKIYLWLVVVTTIGFVTAIIFGMMKIAEYKDAAGM